MRLLALAIALTACARASTAPTPAPSYPSSYETIITGGKNVDGTGNPWVYGDVGIAGGRIARITRPGMLARAAAQRRIDARGLVVAPGVFDIQAHSEEQLLAGDSRVVSMITQGVTTAIMGEGDTPGQLSATMIEGDRLVEAVEEALRIGREGGVPVEIYHLKAAGMKNWPKMRTVIDRGELKEGWYADIMIFDPGTIIDRATYEQPHQLSVSVRHVLVNEPALTA